MKAPWLIYAIVCSEPADAKPVGYIVARGSDGAINQSHLTPARYGPEKYHLDAMNVYSHSAAVEERERRIEKDERDAWRATQPEREVWDFFRRRVVKL
jgi:hypothetical protein